MRPTWTEGVWVHNSCWDRLPDDAKPTNKTTPDGRPLYTFKDANGNQVTAYQGSDGRWYDPKEHAPDAPTATDAKAKQTPVAPESKGPLAEPGEVYYKTTAEATKAAEALGFKKVPNQYVHGEAVYYNPKTKTYISRDVGSGDGNGAHNGGVWKQAESIADLGRKETRLGTFDANLNKIGK